MPKGFFNQCLVVLFKKEININDLKPFIKDTIIKEIDEGENIYINGPQLVLDYKTRSKPELNGQVYIDLIQEPWPDDMNSNDNNIIVAWTMGSFGPFTFPGNLGRAVQQSWAWKEASDQVKLHKSFVRVRLNYLSDKKNPDFNKVIEERDLNEEYLKFEKEMDEEESRLSDELEENNPTPPLEVINPVDELEFLTKAVVDLLEHSDAICYFNPNGEMVLDKKSLKEKFDYCLDNNLPALTTWCNIRFVKLSEEIYLMDSVGNQQLDQPDIEVLFSIKKYSPEDVDTFIRDFSLYICKNDVDFQDGETADGPGYITWHGYFIKHGDNIYDPPRTTIRWIANDNTTIPKNYLPPKARKKGWKFW